MSNDLVSTESSRGSGGPADSDVAGLPAGAGASPVPVEVGRKAAIEAVMRADIDRYYAEGLDRQYAAILAGEAAEANPDSGSTTVPLAWRDARDAFVEDGGVALVHEWEGQGGFRVHYQRVQDAAAAAVKDLPTVREQRVFMAGFDRDLTMATRYHVFDALAYSRTIAGMPADADTVAEFASTDVGAALVREWGSAAGIRVRTVRHVAQYLYDRMTDSQAAEFGAWFDDLSPTQVKAVMKAVANA